MMSEIYDDLIDGEEPEIEPQSDTQVSKAGEEIPLDVKPESDEQDLISEDPLPKTDEPENQVPEGTGQEVGEPELTPEQQRFVELGLDKQFKGGLPEAIDRIPNMNKYISDLERERNFYRDQMATRKAEPKNEPPSPEEFYEKFQTDPQKTIIDTMNPVLDGINKQFEKIQMDTFINSKPDFYDMQPHMERELQQHPELAGLGVRALPVLYRMAKGTQLSRASAESSKLVAVTPPPNKASAETSVGKKSPPVVKDRAYYQGLSEEELEKELGVTPLYRD